MSGKSIAAIGIFVALISAAVAKSDSISINFDGYSTGALPGSNGADTRTPGGPNWWYPSNAATSATVVNLSGSNNALLVYNNGNGNDGVVDNVHSPRLNVLAGESGSDAQPGAGAHNFSSSFIFRTVSDTAVSNFFFKSESWGRDRTTWLQFSNDGHGNLVADYTGVSPTDQFTTVTDLSASPLHWGQWYRVDTTINFVDGTSNDVVNVNVYDSSNNLVWTVTNTTWEQYYRLDPEQLPNGNKVTGVDSVQFQMRQDASGINAGVYVDDLSYASAPLPSVAWVGMGLLAMLGVYRLARAITTKAAI